MRLMLTVFRFVLLSLNVLFISKQLLIVPVLVLVDAHEHLTAQDEVAIMIIITRQVNALSRAHVDDLDVFAQDHGFFLAVRLLFVLGNGLTTEEMQVHHHSF